VRLVAGVLLLVGNATTTFATLWFAVFSFLFSLEIIQAYFSLSAFIELLSLQTRADLV
jgi:hypothetical protein